MTEEQPLFRHILVPADGSQHSMTAGKLAVQIASRTRSRLSFLYVVDPSVAEGISKSSGREAKQIQEELATSGQRSLDHLAHLAREAGLEAGKTIRTGEPYKEITDWAGEQSVDLIIIGQIGRQGLQRILIGSVTERVIEHAPCPVLVVR
jgi:nucleotide-binding universal stress UspA family protein